MTETAVNDFPDEAHRRVLVLMARYDDHVIARRLGVSVTTVRRRIKAVYELLGVNNRFAAGVAVAKRGWL